MGVLDLTLALSRFLSGPFMPSSWPPEMATTISPTRLTRAVGAGNAVRVAKIWFVNAPSNAKIPVVLYHIL